jgi:hypothetical protein
MLRHMLLPLLLPLLLLVSTRSHHAPARTCACAIMSFSIMLRHLLLLLLLPFVIHTTT